MNSESLYIDLGDDYVTRMALLADKSLGVEAFAAKYATSVQAHYRARGQDLDYDAAYREAMDLHAYLMGI